MVILVLHRFEDHPAGLTEWYDFYTMRTSEEPEWIGWWKMTVRKREA